jgi:hypothetical protein
VDGGGSGSHPDLDGSSDCAVVHPWAAGIACAEAGVAASDLDGGGGGCLSSSLGTEALCGPGLVGEADMGTPRSVSRGGGSRGLGSCSGRRGTCACRAKCGAWDCRSGSRGDGPRSCAAKCATLLLAWASYSLQLEVP